MSGRFVLCADAGPMENVHGSRGIGRVTAQLLTALGRLQETEGFELAYLSRSVFPELAGRHVRRGVSAMLAGATPRPSMRLADYWQLVDTSVAAREIRRVRPDVFLACDPHNVPLSSHYPTVGILYDVLPLLFPQSYLRSAPARFKYHRRLDRLRRTRSLVAISETTRRDAMELGGFAGQDIVVAHLAADERRFHPYEPALARAYVAERFGLDAPYFLYVGASDERKNLAFLVHAFARSPVSRDAMLVIAGSLRGHGEVLRDSVRDLPAASRIRWLDYVPDESLAPLYSASTALVFPSLYEGFGLPLIEAQACGCLVLASDIPAFREVAEDSVVYFDPTDEGTLVTALESAMRPGSELAALRARGRKNASRFTWEATASKTLAACVAAIG